MSLSIFEDAHDSVPTISVEVDAAGNLKVQDSALLFNGAFMRSGDDLFIENADAPRLHFADYFATETPADIFDVKGAVLRGDTVAKLAGPLAPAQYAQSGAVVGGSPIGQVETLEGVVNVQRVDGSVETLQVGAKIFQQDVIQTEDGGTVSVTFVDGTIFTLASASRMVIDSLIYDPGSSENSGGFSLIQGSFVFIAGQVAKTGGMEVNTPSSTMGIRGTTVVVEVATANGVVTSEVTLTQDPDGDVGVVELRDLEGELVATITETDTKWIVSALDGGTREVVRTTNDDLEDSVLIAEAFAAFRSATSRVDGGDTFVSLSDPITDAGQNEPGTEVETDLEVDSIDEPDAIDGSNDIEEVPEADDVLPIDEGSIQLEDQVQTPTVIAVQGFEDATEDNAIEGVVSAEASEEIALTFGLGRDPSNGSAQMSEDGSFAFIPDADFNGTDSFTYVVFGPEGELAQGTVVVEVLPVNDAPVAGDTSTSVLEDGSVSGRVDASDVDGDVLSYSVAGLPANGEVLVLSNGTYSYTPEPDFEGTDSFAVRVTDPGGETALANISITIQGADDAPVVVTTVAQSSRGVTEDVGSGLVGGTLEATDVDAGAVLTWQGSAEGAFGALNVLASGAWSYQIDPALADSLNPGEVVTETFTATVTDQSALTDTIAISIAITGTNDLPVITSTATDAVGAVTEDDEVAQVSGALAATDVDSASSLEWTTSAEPTYGSFEITPAGVWTYTLGVAASQELAQGTVFEEVLSVSVSDGVGIAQVQQVIITLTGTNDVPVLTTASGANVGAVAEDTLEASAGGQLSANDVDAGDQVTWSGISAATLGSFDITEQGAWTYVLDPALADDLAEGETKVETLQATGADEFGATVPQIVSVTVTGANDGPVVSDESVTIGDVTEDDEEAEASGTLIATDIDSDVTWSGSAEGDYGDFVLLTDGSWTYQLRSETVQELAQGQTLTDSFTAQASDGLSDPVTQSVTITITGTNDSPVLVADTSVLTGAVVENGTVTSASGTLQATDVDDNSTLVWTGNATGTYGTFAITAGGVWTYSLIAAAADELFEGQQVTESFTALVSDGIADPVSQTVVLTITGTNDDPVVTTASGGNTGTVTEGDEQTQTSGALTAQDIDVGDAVSWSGASEAEIGSFSLNPDGTWTYSLDNAAADALQVGETAIERFVAVAQDGKGGQVSQTIEVSVIGTNDRPILSTNSIFETVEGEAVGGTLTGDDVDGEQADLVFTLGDNPAGNGTVFLNPDGSFTYQPDDGFLGVERFDYIATDADGGASVGQATIEVESNPDNNPDQNVSIGLNTQATVDTAAGAIEIEIETTETTSVNLAIALDRSTSIGLIQWQQLLASVQNALSSLADQFAGSDTSVDVQLITFASDVDVTETFDLQDPALLAAINSSNLIYRGGSTSWDLAFQKAGEFFFSEPAVEPNFLLFVTDGRPTEGSWVSRLEQLQNPDDAYSIDISAFGFGSEFVLDDLRVIDEDAVFLEDSQLLAEAFATTPIFNPELISLKVELEADGGDTVVIADETSDALLVEGTNFELPLASIENIIDLLGTSNRISITTQFDVDNDTSTAEIELFSTDLIGKADVAQISDGLDGADLIFGSDEADALSGAGGNDILLGLGGNDTLIGGEGVDQLRAGAGDDILVLTETAEVGDSAFGQEGRDTLAIDAVGQINELIANLSLSGIEAIDMENGLTNELVLTLADIEGLSDTSDSALEALLESVLPNGRTVYGETGDTLELSGDGVYDITNLGNVSDGAGTTLSIYEFSDGAGNALATLGVDSDIAVTTTNVPIG